MESNGQSETGWSLSLSNDEYEPIERRDGMLSLNPNNTTPIISQINGNAHAA